MSTSRGPSCRAALSSIRLAACSKHCEARGALACTGRLHPCVSGPVHGSNAPLTARARHSQHAERRTHEWAPASGKAELSTRGATTTSLMFIRIDNIFTDVGVTLLDAASGNLLRVIGALQTLYSDTCAFMPWYCPAIHQCNQLPNHLFARPVGPRLECSASPQLPPIVTPVQLTPMLRWVKPCAAPAQPAQTTHVLAMQLTCPRILSDTLRSAVSAGTRTHTLSNSSSRYKTPPLSSPYRPRCPWPASVSLTIHSIHPH
jgi:hypothetical protein